MFVQCQIGCMLFPEKVADFICNLKMKPFISQNVRHLKVLDTVFQKQLISSDGLMSVKSKYRMCPCQEK